MKRMLVGMALALVVGAVLAPTPAAGEPLRAAKLVIEGKAKGDGEVKLSFAPEGGEAQEIKVTIVKGMGAGEVAEDVAKELKVALGDSFRVEQFDGSKIKIESGKDGPGFGIEIAGVSVPGIALTMK